MQVPVRNKTGDSSDVTTEQSNVKTPCPNCQQFTTAPGIWRVYTENTSSGNAKMWNGDIGPPRGGSVEYTRNRAEDESTQVNGSMDGISFREFLEGRNSLNRRG